MKKLSEQSTLTQLSTVLGFIALCVGLFGGIALKASDQVIDDKYATDDDLRAVQETLTAQVTALAATVQTNTTTNKATTKSVDGLTLVVLDLQRKEIAAEIFRLEAEKREQGANWNQTEEKQLRDKQQALADLNTQRAALFARVIAN